jgi:hypothetical protein
MRSKTTGRAAMLLVLPLFALLTACDNPVGGGHDLRQATGVVITDPAGEVLVGTDGAGGWDGPLIAVAVGGEIPIQIHFIDPDGDRFQVPLTDADHTLRIDFAPPGIVDYQGTGAQGVLRGLAAGATEMTIHIWHGAHADFSAPPLRVENLQQ